MLINSLRKDKNWEADQRVLWLEEFAVLDVIIVLICNLCVCLIKINGVFMTAALGEGFVTTGHG